MAYRLKFDADKSITAYADKAIADYSIAIRLEPKRASAYLGRSYVYLSQGRYGEAIADQTEAIRLDPKDPKAYYWRAFAYESKGDHDKAIADYTEAIRFDKKDTYAYGGRGNAYERKGDHGKALADFTEVIRLDPNDAGAYYARGAVFGNSHDYGRAISDFTEAIRLDPKDSDAYYARGFVRDENGDKDKALADFNDAVRLNPKNARAFDGRARVYQEKGEVDKAIADYSEAIRLDPMDSDAYWARGILRAHRRETDKAVADYTELIRLKPKLFEAFYNRGLAHCDKGDFDKAIADYTEAIRLEPNNSKAFYGRGVSQDCKGNSNEAIADLTEAIRLNPRDGESFHARGVARAHKGDKKAAIADLDSAISLASNNFKYRELRGALRIEHGDYDGGAIDLKAAIALDPQDQAATFENWPKKQITPEALRRGEEQVRQMLHDRPVMAKYGEKARALYQWAARKFAGEDMGQEIRWDGSEPLHAPSDCDCPRDGQPDRIRLRKSSADKPDNGKEHSFEELWMCAVFELYNASNTEGFARTYEAARRGEFTRDQYVMAQAIVESLTAEKTRSFYIHVYLPWTKEVRESTNPTLWRIACRANCRQKLMLPVEKHTDYWNDYANWFDMLSLEVWNVEKANAYVQKLKTEAVSNEEKADVLVCCGKEYDRLGATPDRVLALFDEAIRLDPKNVQAHIGRGRIIWCLRGHGFDDAIKEFSEAIRLEPGGADAYRERAEIYYKLLLSHCDNPNRDFDTQVAKALADFNAAIRLNSTDVAALVERGVVYDKTGDFEKALTDESEAIRIDPMNLDAYAQRSQIYREKGEASKANADAAELQRLSQKKGSDNGANAVPANAVAEKPAAAPVIHPLDVLAVFVPNALPNAPIYGPYLVEPDGNLLLPLYYGRVKVAGMTQDQAEEAVHQLLWQLIRDPQVFLKSAGRAKWLSGRAPAIPYRIIPDDSLKIFALIRPEEPIDGEFRVASDGTVDLGKTHGKVVMKGLTIDEAEKAIGKQLKNEDGVLVTLAGWEPEHASSAWPQAAEVAEMYFRAGDGIRLSAYGLLSDPEIVKRIGLTDSQRRTLLRAMAENELRGYTSPAAPIAGKEGEVTDQGIRNSKEARMRVEAALTPRQLHELKDLSLPKLAVQSMKDSETLKIILAEGGPQRLADVIRRRDELDDIARKDFQKAEEKSLERTLELLSESQKGTLREMLYNEWKPKSESPENIADFAGFKSYVANLRSANGYWGGTALYLADAKVREQLAFDREQEQRRQAIDTGFKTFVDTTLAEIEKLLPAQQATQFGSVRTKIDKANKDMHEQIAALLTPKQMSALREIVVRMHARNLRDNTERFDLDYRGIYFVNGYASYLDAIAATAQQRAAIVKIYAQLDEEIRQIDARTKTERLKLLTPAESQRLREEIDRNDW
jgi:tetratricopeptide (TPR) repeat protein